MNVAENKMPAYHIDPDGPVCRHAPHKHFTLEEVCAQLNDAEQRLLDAYLHFKSLNLGVLIANLHDPDMDKALYPWFTKLQGILADEDTERGRRIVSQSKTGQPLYRQIEEQAEDFVDRETTKLPPAH